MKLIQAMKKLKELNGKAEDLRVKVSKHCADLTIENPAYPNPKQQIDEWIQSHHDTLKEILRLRVAVQRTNLNTMVPIEISGQVITKSIAEWIHRRRDLAKLEQDVWSKLGDRGLKEQNIQTGPGMPVTEVRIRRYFDPQARDQKVELYRTEPTTIDANLEIVNATTDLIEA